MAKVELIRHRPVRRIAENCTKNADCSALALLLQELRRCDARRILEQTGEMVGVRETEFLGYLGHTHAAQEQPLGPHDDETADVVLGALVQRIAHDVAKVARRQAQFTRAILHAGQATPLLLSSCIIVHQQLLETGQDVAACRRVLLELAHIESAAIVQYQLDVRLDDVVGQCLITVLGELGADVLHQAIQYALLLGCQDERLVGIIGEEMVVRQPVGNGRVTDELGVKHQHPAVILLQRAIVTLAAYLPRGIGQQGPVTVLIGADAINQILGKLALQEQGKHIEAVERVPYLPHLIVVDDGHMRMIDRSSDVERIVVRMINMQLDLLHCYSSG